MQTREMTIKYLKKQLADQVAKDENLYEWLRTTTGYAEQYFGSNHQRIRLMRELAQSIYGNKIVGKTPNELIEIEDKANGYITDFLEDLEDQETQNQMDKLKIKYPLGLSQEIFWTLFIAIVTGAFGLGLLFGNFKFDRDKIDYYNRNITLEKVIDSMKLQADQSKSTLVKYKDSITALNDSIITHNKLKRDLDRLKYLTEKLIECDSVYRAKKIIIKRPSVRNTIIRVSII